MSSTSAFLGLDIGSRQVGVALANGDELLAVRHSVIDRTKQDLVAAVAALVTEHRVGIVIIGWPRNLDGEETAQTAQVQADIVLLQAALPQGVTVVTSDETLTSVEARNRLVQAGESLEHEHAEAAKIILEDYLRTVDRKSGR